MRFEHSAVCYRAIARSGLRIFVVWASLVTAPLQFPVATALVSVDLLPPFALMSPIQSLGNISNTVTGPGVSTPASTPQQASSPDSRNQTPVATPTAEPSVEPHIESDAHLIDVTDDSWGVVFGHRLNCSNSLTDYMPSLASGLLIKRGNDGSTSSTERVCAIQGPACIVVNLMWLGASGNGNPLGEANPRAPPSAGIVAGSLPIGTRGHESVLKDLLVTYRGLGLLARLRGMKDTEGGLVPWHVAAASRGVRALEYCL